MRSPVLSIPVYLGIRSLEFQCVLILQRTLQLISTLGFPLALLVQSVRFPCVPWFLLTLTLTSGSQNCNVQTWLTPITTPNALHGFPTLHVNLLWVPHEFGGPLYRAFYLRTTPFVSSRVPLYVPPYVSHGSARSVEHFT